MIFAMSRKRYFTCSIGRTIHIVPFKQPKMRLWQSRESEDLGELQVLPIIFQPNRRIKMKHFRLRRSVYSGSRLALLPNLVPLVDLKCLFSDDETTLKQITYGHWNVIFPPSH
jgi:hypothetical protein